MCHKMLIKPVHFEQFSHQSHANSFLSSVHFCFYVPFEISVPTKARTKGVVGRSHSYSRLSEVRLSSVFRRSLQSEFRYRCTFFMRRTAR